MGQYWPVAKLPMREPRCSIVAGVGGGAGCLGGWNQAGLIEPDRLGPERLRGSPGCSSVLI